MGVAEIRSARLVRTTRARRSGARATGAGLSYGLALVPHGLWDALERPVGRLLILDYDGTLAPFRRDRNHATMLHGIRPLLHELARTRGDCVAIVSGRPLATLQPLVGPLPVTLFGEHGWERRGPRGAVHRYRLAAPTAIDLARAVARAEERGLRSHLEVKRTAVVLHTRGLPVARARALENSAVTAWAPIDARGRVRLAPIAGGIELRASARDKGSAVHSLVRHHPDARLVVMVGDDRTDEDAFAALPRRGFGLRVGHAGHPTGADGWLASPVEVREFLTAWLGCERPADARPSRR